MRRSSVHSDASVRITIDIADAGYVAANPELHETPTINMAKSYAIQLLQVNVSFGGAYPWGCS